MIPLPIAYREMLVLARSKAVYRGRVALSIMLFLAGTGMAALHHFAGVPPTVLTMNFLPLVAFFLGIFCLFAGAHATADAISKEKREGTLGLLYLTHMRTGQILFGKLIAHTLVVFYGVLTAFPLLSLMLLLGGVEAVGMLKIFLATMNLLFFSASIGLCVSSVGVDRKRTAGAVTWVILFFWFVPGILTQVLNMRPTTPRWVVEASVAISPTSVFAYLGPGIPTYGVGFWTILLVTHLMAWAFLLVGAYHLPRRWQEKAAPAGKRTMKERWQQFAYGGGTGRLARRTRFLGANPIFWLTARNRLKPLTNLVFFLFFIGLFGWITIWNARMNPQVAMPMIIAFTIILMQVQKLRLGGVATTRLNEEHEQGTLELLLSTPLSVRDFVRGETQALFWQFRVPFLLIFVLQACICAWFVSEEWPFMSNDTWLVAFFGGVFLVLHYLDLWTITRYAMWACVTLKQPKQATQHTAAMIMLLPVVVFGLILAMGGLVFWYFEIRWTMPDGVLPLLYASLVLINDLFWLIVFRWRFGARLREFASKRFVQEEKPGVLERLFHFFRFRKATLEPPVLHA